ncbi:MAG: flagellar hook-basal body complex protein FliE [Candidatus Schekmanbacteria bacterium]|nr:MAG: flagellar hook-basal body complex protein FliE [Candidatus Schekmanbacteria bacterium]
MKIGKLPLKSLYDELRIRTEKPAKEGQSFSDTIKNMINEVEKYQKEADISVQKFALGENRNIHETMIALQKADVSFKLMMQIRNKVLSAYQEIMKMPI